MQLARTIFFYFVIYSFIGWVIEGLFNLTTRGTFIKANFLTLPLKPMYGIAATILIYVKESLPFPLFLLSALFIPSLVEYVTADLLFKCFKLKYWDYSHCPYNVSGYICLRFSIYWVILSLLLVYGVQPFIARFYLLTTWFWIGFFPIGLLILLTDLILTVRSKRQLLLSQSD